jgi:hypothetical protein
MSRRTWIRLLLLSGLLIALGFVLPGWARAPKGKKYALLVGVRSYDHAKLTDLKYTENDVEELGEVLKKAGYEVVLLRRTPSRPRVANERLEGRNGERPSCAARGQRKPLCREKMSPTPPGRELP